MYVHKSVFQILFFCMPLMFLSSFSYGLWTAQQSIKQEYDYEQIGGMWKKAVVAYF